MLFSLLEPCRQNPLMLINDRNTSHSSLGLAQLCCGRSGDGAATTPACPGCANGLVALCSCPPSPPWHPSLQSCLCPKERSWSWFQEDLSHFDLFCAAKQVLGCWSFGHITAIYRGAGLGKCLLSSLKVMASNSKYNKRNQTKADWFPSCSIRESALPE